MGLNIYASVVAYIEVNRNDLAEEINAGVYEYLKSEADDHDLNKILILPNTKTKSDDENPGTPFYEIEKHYNKNKYMLSGDAEKKYMKRKENKAKKQGSESALIILIDGGMDCIKTQGIAICEKINVAKIKKIFGLKKTPILQIVGCVHNDD